MAMRASTMAMLLALAAASGCASKLPRDLTNNAPTGTALLESLDMSTVTFSDLETGETFTVADYMAREGRDWLLLTFGSKGCASCNRKAETLTGEIIGRHPLYLTDAGQRFEIVGINTDREPYARLKGYLKSYPFIRWSDPAGMRMLEFFMPAGHFRVPLTVMVNKSGIAWRVMPDDPMSVEAMIAKVEETIGLKAPGGDAVGGGVGDGSGGGDAGGGAGTGDAGGGDAGGAGGDGSGSCSGTGPAPAALTAEAPGRLKKIQVTGCDGVAKSLDEALGAGDVRFVSVSKGPCDAACQANLAELQTVASGVSLTGSAPDAGACATGRAFQGGGEFFDVFKTYFDWAYPVQENPDDYTVSLPPVAGPLVLGFAASGQLVFSHEGALQPGQLAAAMASPKFGERPAGPDFKLFTPAKGEFGFSSLRQQARFTVVSAAGIYPVPCGSCVDELQKWSEPGELVDFCAARPGDCQVVFTETNVPDDGVGTAQFYDMVVNGDGARHQGLAAMSIRVPLYLDPVAKYGDVGNEHLQRLYDGYMLAAKPEWETDPRTFVYDLEGKIVAMFRSESHPGADPVLAKVKELLRTAGAP